MAGTADLADVIGAVTAPADRCGWSVTPAAGRPRRRRRPARPRRDHGAVTLDTPVRFADPAEAAATLAIRTGDPAGLDFYADHGRIHTPPPASVSHPDARTARAARTVGPVAGAGDALDSALTAWAADRAAGRDSLLLAGSNAVVTELNARARATRHALAEALTRPEVRAAGRHRRLRRRRRPRPPQRPRPADHRPGVGQERRPVHRHRPHRRRRPPGPAHRHPADAARCPPATSPSTCSSATPPPSTSPKAPPSTPPTPCSPAARAREQLYVALTRGRHANHLHLAPTPADRGGSGAPRPAPGAGTPATPIRCELADRRCWAAATSGPRPPAPCSRTPTPARRLQAAVDRYLDAHALAGGGVPPASGAGDAGGPLPWLPPPPDPDRADAHGAELAEYLQQRADLIHALAATITADHLPDTDWADGLRAGDPDLARRLAVWRAATGAADHPHPLGPVATSTPDGPGPAARPAAPAPHRRRPVRPRPLGRAGRRYRPRPRTRPRAHQRPGRRRPHGHRLLTRRAARPTGGARPINPPDGGRDRLRHSMRQPERAATLHRHRQPTPRGIRR